MKRLSPTEFEVMELCAQGFKVEEIAQKVSLNHRSINGIMARLRFTYDARTTHQLIAILVINNMIMVDRNINKRPVGEKEAHNLRLQSINDMAKNINKVISTHKQNL